LESSIIIINYKIANKAVFEECDKERNVAFNWLLLLYVSTLRTTSDLCKTVSPAVLFGKGKGIPLQASTGPHGSRRLRLPDFKTIGT